jgi:serine/threonine protein kinase
MRKSTGATGTISYCAPEVLKRDASGRYANFTTKSDIFSLGMILYFMCFSRLPYSSADSIQEEFEDLDQLRAEISAWSGFQEERRERPDLPDQLYEFLKRLLAIDPLGRPSADEIMLAIQTGSNLDSTPRLGSDPSGNITLGVSKRIQSLDSPAPGTPVSGGGRALSSTRSEDDHEDRPIPSKITPTSEPLPKGQLEDMIDPRDQPQVPRTPLLMPPPSTILSNIQNQFVVYRHHALSWAILNHQILILAIKLIFFIIKTFALTKPCQPLATNPLIAYPLLVLAALDLGLGTGVEWRISGLLALVHFAILALAATRGGLCVGSREHWDWEVD